MQIISAGFTKPSMFRLIRYCYGLLFNAGVIIFNDPNQR